MSDWPKPTWEPLWLACKACGHKWDDWQPSHVPAETWIAHLRTHSCPKCGKGYSDHVLLLRTKPLSDDDP